MAHMTNTPPFEYHDPFSNTVLRLVSEDDATAILSLEHSDDMNKHTMAIELSGDVWQNLLAHMGGYAKHAADEEARLRDDVAIMSAELKREQAQRIYWLRRKQLPNKLTSIMIHRVDCSASNVVAGGFNPVSIAEIIKAFAEYRKTTEEFRKVRTNSIIDDQPRMTLGLCQRCRPLGDDTYNVRRALNHLLRNDDDLSLIDDVARRLCAAAGDHGMPASDHNRTSVPGTVVDWR